LIVAIKSFNDKDTEALWEGRKTKKSWPINQIGERALRKLNVLDAATKLNDLRLTPGNRFESLEGTDEYSIRINQRWRICFAWEPADQAAIDSGSIDLAEAPGSALNVYIDDYH
jgi:proteic killer suppression protein